MVRIDSFPLNASVGIVFVTRVPDNFLMKGMGCERFEPVYSTAYFTIPGDH